MEIGNRTAGRRGKPLFALVALVVLGVLAAGCAKVSGPSGWAQPEVADKVMYVTLEQGKLTAVDSSTFQKIWTFPAADDFACGGGATQNIKRDGIYGSPAVDDSNVYFGTYDGAIYSVTKSTGDCDWRLELGGNVLAGPILGKEGLYVASTDGYVYLLDPKTGDQRKKFNTGEAWATPLLTDDALYVATMKGELWKLDPATLENTWRAPFKVSAALLTPPRLVGDNTVVVGGIGKTLYGVDASTGDQKWASKGGNWFWGEPAIDGTTIYTTDLDGEVRAFDGTTGESKWDAPFLAQNAIRSGPVLAGDKLVAVDNSGVVYRIDKATGQAIGQPNLLNEDVLATPLVRVAADAATGSPTTSASGSATPRASASTSAAGTGSATASASPSATETSGGTEKVYIVTKSGHVFEFDPEAQQPRATQVVSK